MLKLSVWRKLLKQIYVVLNNFKRTTKYVDILVKHGNVRVYIESIIIQL